MTERNGNLRQFLLACGAVIGSLTAFVSFETMFMRPLVMEQTRDELRKALKSHNDEGHEPVWEEIREMEEFMNAIESRVWNLERKD